MEGGVNGYGDSAYQYTAFCARSQFAINSS